MSGDDDKNKIRTVTHTASGASVGIHPFGATVTSFKTADGTERLFVSRDAKLDGSKAIRGGIPLVFPIFGPPAADSGSTMPQHGFARNNYWTPVQDSATDNAEHAGVSYQLDFPDSVAGGRGTNNPWATDSTELKCRLTYAVKVNGQSMTTTLTIENTGPKSFEFQALFHTYYLVNNRAALDAKQCYVKGLRGYTVADKVTKQDEYVHGESGDPITISGETDRVYAPPADKNASPLQVTIGVGNNKTMSLTATGRIHETTAAVSSVVWNPHEQKAAGMSDFGSDQYIDMLCVEPGLLLKGQPSLEPGQTAVFEQVVQAS